MTVFQYSAISKNGRQLSGEIDALTRDAVIAQLNRSGHFPVDVREAATSRTSPRQGHLFSKLPGSAELTVFTRELAMLLKAGMPLDRALLLIENETASVRLSSVIGRLRHLINDGRTLNEAMAECDTVFPPIYVNMVRIAEATGTLDTVLARLADARESEARFRAKALSAMLYPLFLVASAIAAVLVMFVFVVPRFKDLLASSGNEIPAAAGFVIGVSDWLSDNGFLLMIGICIALLGGMHLLRDSAFKQRLNGLLLDLPVAGRLIQLHLMTRFCRTLGTLVENGVEFPAALKLTRQVAGNSQLETTLDEAHAALRKGQDFTRPLAASGYFPSTVTQMLRIGQETGNLSESLLHLADGFENRFETAMQRLFTILGPAIVAVVSILVAGIIIAIISAVISVNDLAI